MKNLLLYVHIYFLLAVYPGLAGTYASGGMGTFGFLFSTAAAGLMQYALYRILQKLIRKRV